MQGERGEREKERETDTDFSKEVGRDNFISHCISLEVMKLTFTFISF